MFKNNLMKKILVVAACLVALPAAAQIDTWNFTDNNDDWFDSLTVAGAGGNDLTVTGWSNTGNGGTTIEQGLLNFYGNSLGFKNNNEGSGTPSHSIDNYDNGYFDMVLLEFNEKVDLDGFGIGWARENYVSGNNQGQGHADISVVAFTGAGSAAIAGNTWDNIASSSNWSARYSNVDQGSYQAVTPTVTSKYWLIGAYNPNFNASGSSSWSDDNDGFKLASVSGETVDDGGVVDVPEPSSLAILALGLLALSSTRKKQQS